MSSQSAPAIEAHSISKRFGQVHALHGVSLAAHAGAVTCLTRGPTLAG